MVKKMCYNQVMKNKVIELSHVGLVGILMASAARIGHNSVVTCEDLMFFKSLLNLKLRNSNNGASGVVLNCPINFKDKDLQGEDFKGEILKKWEVFKYFAPVSSLMGKDGFDVRFATLDALKGQQEGAGLYNNDFLWQLAATSVNLDEDYQKANDATIEEKINFELYKYWCNTSKILKDKSIYNSTLETLAKDIANSSQNISFNEAKKAIGQAIEEYNSVHINDLNVGFIYGIEGLNLPESMRRNAFVESGYNVGLGQPIELEPQQ